MSLCCHFSPGSVFENNICTWHIQGVYCAKSVAKLCWTWFCLHLHSRHWLHHQTELPAILNEYFLMKLCLLILYIYIMAFEMIFQGWSGFTGQSRITLWAVFAFTGFWRSTVQKVSPHNAWTLAAHVFKFIITRFVINIFFLQVTKEQRYLLLLKIIFIDLLYHGFWDDFSI